MKGSALDSKHMCSWLKHGSGSVMAWDWTRKDFLIVTDPVNHNGTSGIISEVNTNILSANLYLV